MKQLLVTDEWNRKRLDRFIASHYVDISRAYLQKLCSNEEVLVNGVAQKSGYKLHSTEKVKILHDMTKIGKPPSITLPIVYEDNNIIVVDKPSGILAHGLSKFHDEPSVASFLREHAQLSSISYRSGIVHRLDRATSGLMICTKNEDTLSFLQKQFADRKVQKTYVAVVVGHPKLKKAILDLPIERNPNSPARFRIGPNGKPSKTTMKVLKQTPLYSLVELTPHTGRTHQLRVHMQYIGNPIVGDVLYEGKEYLRLMLHAQTLELEIPDFGKKKFKSKLPKEFMEYMSAATREK